MSTKTDMMMTRASGFVTRGAARSGRRSVRALALVLMTPLGACGLNRTLPPPAVPYDYHDRHPVVLSEAPHVIDVFPPTVGARIDPTSMARIDDFASRYRRFGHGQITVLTPIGGANPAVPHTGVNEVRRALASAGVRGNIYVGRYQVSDPNLAAPIRLSFQAIKAKVAGRCGEWPADLASGGSLEGWENKSYWNFGCANQATLAAQVADPRDLVSPRGEAVSDIEMRMRAINRVRRGEDPTTMWKMKATEISSVGGN